MSEIRTENDGGDPILLCPACGDGYIHHEDVLVFSRRIEDGKSLVARIGASGLPEFDETFRSRNPSARRDGIAIAFWCESCGADDFELTIEQHKGNSFIAWRNRQPSGGRGRRRP